ncbi:LysR family transcriptional regulator [Pacificimonas flava]|uniref:LysR family transcriptional regulator n=2 Tax=Pacificimonas TaxID=1960290 RepID=A0A219BA87_9SPHN|nr:MULTISPECIES: LysR substrate-binding domain-containing protein [Pacificimonas]MBZ6379124.1 LysR family transcriptional regulator [Pacificimonas aurantium]OWV34719.1 LysR family transcriptional regulator [Pacificimonas flava]
MKRTLLPLNALRVFDAAARHLSFTKAADELHVTPAAVGQQIRTLEETLGVVLFRRLTRNLELTPEAERALPALREGFTQIESAVDAMQAGQADKVLTIGAPRAVIAKWLAPRLARLGASAEDRFILVPTDETGSGAARDFSSTNMDLAIIWGAMPAEEELSGKRIAAEELVLVVAADQRDSYGRPADLGEAPLIHYPGHSWQEWFDAAGASHADLDGGLSVADWGLAIDAAAAGYGAARVPRTLVSGDLAAGRVAALFEPTPCDEAFWLVAPPQSWRQPKVKAMVDALMDETGKS